MNFENISKYDLDEPYDVLTEELEFEDIIKLQELFSGKQILFPKRLINKNKNGMYSELSKCIGENKAIFVMKQYLGDQVYFPDIKRSLRKKIHELIIKEFNGFNCRELATKYGFSERHTKRIIKNSSKKTIQKIL